jgi:outer membrane protein
VTSARASRLRAEADLQRTINEASLDVESALAQAERARARITVTARSVAAAEARLRAAEGKYQEGVGILLEVTDARTAYSSALADQIQAEYDYRTALIAVQKALGTLAPPQAEEK